MIGIKGWFCRLQAMAFLVLLCAAFPLAAHAAETRPEEPFSPITGAGSGITISTPGGIAVDEGTGNLFLNDATTLTDILGGEGAAPVGLVAPFQLTGSTFASATNGVAFDNAALSPAKGTVYVVNGSGKIKKFTRNPGTEMYESAGELTATPPAGRAFNATGNAGAAVDTLGNLYVADFSCQCIVKFDSSGGQVASYNVGAPSPIVRPNAVALDAAGNIYVSRAAGAGVFQIAAGGSGEVVNPPVTTIVASGNTGIATDPAKAKLYIALGNRVAQYDTTTLKEDFSFGIGKLGTTTRLAVNSATNRIYVSDNGVGKKNVAVFGPPITLPSATTKAASGVAGTKATLNGVVNPQGSEITECKFEYGTTASYGKSVPCEGSIPTDSSDHAVTAAITGLIPNGATYHFRIWVNSVNGEATPQGADRTFVTGSTVVTEPATEIDATTATLNGVVRPEGAQLSACEFEYGTTPSYGQSVPCGPAAALIPDDFDSHAVTGSLVGLDPNTTYHFRLSATSSLGTALGQDLTFTAQGPPLVFDQRPLDVDQTSATLRARINPSGQATTYHFEWGPEGSLGNRIPANFEIPLGAGTEPVVVSAEVTGLSPATVYGFRVVAANAHGTTIASSQSLQTLNEHGLPYDRGFELVSPPNKRPVGNMEQLAVVHQLYQPAATGDQIGYLILNGVEGSPAGGEVIYAGSRASDGWESTEITPPPLVTAPEGDGQHFSAQPGFVRYLDPHDLKCGLVESYNPLTADTPVADSESGVFNLYRWNASDRSYTLITNRIPLNPVARKPDQTGFYKVAGVSDDCSRILFFSKAYSFIPGSTGLYEWDHGVLRDAGLRPDGSVPGLASSELTRIARERGSVGPDGRFFFTATSNEGADSGKKAVFVRKGPADVVDASQPTDGPSLGARYTGASSDGSRVFFLANYGIAGTSSTGPTDEDCSTVSADNSGIHNTACDLYTYDVEAETLVDVSADTNPADTKGAVVQGVMAASRDGSVVYFAARGQLIPEAGRTYIENLQGSGFANVYRYDAESPPGEAVTYVGSLTAKDLANQASINSSSEGNSWSSQANEDGSYFLYASRDGLGANNPEGVESAYLFSSSTGETVCVSCPADGSAPKARLDNALLGVPSVIAGVRPGGSNVPPVSLSEDGRVVFNSEEVLAPGAVQGSGKLVGTVLWTFPVQNNIYEWDHGQVSTLATGAVETLGIGGPDGRDVFVKSFSQLSPRDLDFSADVYDLRAGGGFPPPPDAPVPCSPLVEACQAPAGAPPATSSPATATFAGPGNLPAAKPPARRCRKGKVRRKGRCVAKRAPKKHRNNRAQARTANRNLGGAR